ncbi:conserved hypothetical protein [Paecilomyces variotii No. 5]|uniref:Xylanolytic transcriptional activator regulatory domain-containing protein n=1 Tax=Byssochlamys spectabilis (strain No. 5 / NBRC 109023) TaxID=1356009 RepID=V5FAZ5_BYSSN|nr:conserved hypothetical protein [Paecilomyces variotii No. 5]
MFYTYFWPAHPFILPRVVLQSKVMTNEARSLQAAIEFIGSCYDPSMRQEYFRDIAEALLLQQTGKASLPRSIFNIQAYLLFCVGIYFCGDIDKAMSTLSVAERLALKLQLNKENSILELSKGNAFIAECLRRTWWEIYLFSGHLTAPELHQRFRLYNVDCDTCLPCEDDAYQSGNIPLPMALAEYDAQTKLNASETKTFSSYTYRIDGMRLLSRVIAQNRHTETSSRRYDVELENELIDWLLKLPPSKKRLTREDGTLDEVMVLAHLNIYGYPYTSRVLQLLN